jgi:hypothetical protein
MGLLGSLNRLEVFVDLDEFLLALTQQFFLWILAPDLDELEVIVQTFSHFTNLSTAARFRMTKLQDNG